MDNTGNTLSPPVVTALRAAMPGGAVYLDEHRRQLYAQDVFQRVAAAAAVLQPASTGELAAALAILHDQRISVVPHGGGMSYTGGLVSGDATAVSIDLGRMNRVLEINREDGYVTVECGCTWQGLHEALAGQDLRTPFWGTLSGSRATIGGGLSDNAIFWGSGQHGTAVESLLSLTVVLADGSVIDTGAAARDGAAPFFRHFGPDLTGLFCADSGSLGIKATATLRLLPTLPSREFLAFDFDGARSTIAAMSEIARQNLAAECFGFDPFLQAQRLKRESLASDLRALAGVMRAAGSTLSAVREGARVALAGRSYMDGVDYSVQVIVEDRLDAGAAARGDAVRAICQRLGGREIENSIPKITRANPFGPLNSILGPGGERWLPLHGLFPLSRIQPAFDGTESVLAANRAASEALGVGAGYLLATVSTHCFVLEPVFFWPDERTEIHEDAVQPAHLERLPRHAANPAARAHVEHLRQQLVTLYADMGAAHMQLGRTYPFRETLSPGAAALLTALKDAVDPQRLMNPGALGL